MGADLYMQGFDDHQETIRPDFEKAARKRDELIGQRN